MDKYVITPPSGSTNNSVGAADRPWKEGHFEKLPGINEYLAESTGYGIVSDCTPTISGLTVTVAAGVVHLANGTRKELSATNITLDSADPTNPRIDLVYITADGVVAKITGTAAASPSVPSVPSGGISVAQVSVAAGTTTGDVVLMRNMLKTRKAVAYVDDYGAKGDGVTDDTNAINNALHDAQVVVFSPKTYMINNKGIKPLSGTVLVGNGAELKEITNDLTHYRVISLFRVSNIKIDGFTITGERDTHTGTTGQWGHGIFAETAKNIVISNCTIKNCWGDGILLDAWNQPDNSPCENIIITSCVINNNRRNGVSGVNYDNVLIDNCVISNTQGQDPQSGVEIESTGAVQYTGKMVVRNCYFNANTHNIKVYAFSDGFKMTVDNCILKGGFGSVQFNNANDSSGEFIFVSNVIDDYFRQAIYISKNTNDNCYINLVNTIIENGSTYQGTASTSIDNVINASSDEVTKNIYVDGLYEKNKGSASDVWLNISNGEKIYLKNVEREQGNAHISAMRLTNCNNVNADNIPPSIFNDNKTINSDNAEARVWVYRAQKVATLTISAINLGDEFTVFNRFNYNLTVTLPDSTSYNLINGQSLKVKYLLTNDYMVTTNGTKV